MKVTLKLILPSERKIEAEQTETVESFEIPSVGSLMTIKKLNDKPLKVYSTQAFYEELKMVRAIIELIYNE